MKWNSINREREHVECEMHLNVMSRNGKNRDEETDARDIVVKTATGWKPVFCGCVERPSFQQAGRSTVTKPKKTFFFSRPSTEEEPSG